MRELSGCSGLAPDKDRKVTSAIQTVEDDRNFTNNVPQSLGSFRRSQLTAFCRDQDTESKTIPKRADSIAAAGL